MTATNQVQGQAEKSQSNVASRDSRPTAPSTRGASGPRQRRPCGPQHRPPARSITTEAPTSLHRPFFAKLRVLKWTKGKSRCWYLASSFLLNIQH